MGEWMCVGQGEGVAEGQMVEVTVGERRVVLARLAGRLVAFSAGCPHASARLAEGTLRPGYVVCPLHAYRFDLKSGACLKPRDGPRLTLFAVEQRGQEVWVRLG